MYNISVNRVTNEDMRDALYDYPITTTIITTTHITTLLLLLLYYYYYYIMINLIYFSFSPYRLIYVE